MWATISMIGDYIDVCRIIDIRYGMAMHVSSPPSWQHLNLQRLPKLLRMRLFRHSFLVQAGIDRVWQFYTDIDNLYVITPPGVRLRVERTAPAGSKKIEQGSEACISGNIISPLARSGWHSRITHLSKYVYVDEMLDGGGLFKRWRHTHTFREAPGQRGTGTEIIDEIEFELPYGPLGKMFEDYAARRLEKIFAHRQEATISALATG